jgi:hypothetical protein
MDADDRRIQALLGDDNERTTQNASRYQSYLLKNLLLPIIVTGVEDFPWEEPYILGVWDRQEYEELKKTRPSYMDTFELQALGPLDMRDDIMAKIKRLSDGKVFEIGLSWLCCDDEETDAYTLLKDYGVWYINY